MFEANLAQNVRRDREAMAVNNMAVNNMAVNSAVLKMNPSCHRPRPATFGDSKPNRAKTLSFFGACRACSIDFCQFAPMFRLNAARYRNAIS
jgi:hypothetical protein